MPTFFQKFHERLITELEYDRADMDRELETWIEKNGNSEKSLYKFYKAAVELGEAHYLGDDFKDLERNRKLEAVYYMMLELYLEANWSRSSITRKLNYLRMGEALNHKFKVDVEILPPGKCQYAEQFRDRLFDLESSMQSFPLDYSNCEREGGCACTVAFEPIRDENGQLKRR
jgi:hypothetical protein